MSTKLVIVEGIPGTGKTTTARFIHAWLDDRGCEPCLFLEGDVHHPVSLDGIAYLDAAQSRRLVRRYGPYRSLLEDESVAHRRGTLIQHWRLREQYREQLPEDLYGDLAACDAYETLGPGSIMDLSIERWKAFAARAAQDEAITVLECCLFQDPLTVLVGKHNYPVGVALDHVAKLARAVSGLDPLLVYLDCTSVGQVYERAVENRPRAWLEFVISYLTGQGYGQAHGLEGLSGVIRFYEMLQAWEREMMARLAWRQVVIDVSDWTWDLHQQKLARDLDSVFR